MEVAKQRVKNLIESFPYIMQFTGKTFVVKFGGSVMVDDKAKAAFIQDLALMKLLGINIVLVHGGGPEITKRLARLGIGTEFVNGLRVTTKEVMDEVEMVLAGTVNKELTLLMNKRGIEAVGVSGKDGNLIQATKKMSYVDDELVDLGYVGEVVSINNDFLLSLINGGYLPIIAPIGVDSNYDTYNINADYVATAISTSLKAEKLVFLTDVDGLYRDFSDKSSLIKKLDTSECESIIESKQIDGGMIPKLECAKQAVKDGAHSVHFINGKLEHGLLLEIFTDEGIGTMIQDTEEA